MLNETKDWERICNLNKNKRSNVSIIARKVDNATLHRNEGPKQCPLPLACFAKVVITISFMFLFYQYFLST